MAGMKDTFLKKDYQPRVNLRNKLILAFIRMFTVVAKRERPLGANLDPWDCAAKVQHYSTTQNYKKKGKNFRFVNP